MSEDNLGDGTPLMYKPHEMDMHLKFILPVSHLSSGMTVNSKVQGGGFGEGKLGGPLQALEERDSLSPAFSCMCLS